MATVIHCFIVNNSYVDTCALRERGFNVDLSASESIMYPLVYFNATKRVNTQPYGLKLTKYFS